MVRETLANAIVGAVAADKDRVHRGLVRHGPRTMAASCRTVTEPPRAGTAEEGERLVVGVEDHLRSPSISDGRQWLLEPVAQPLATDAMAHLAGIGAHEGHPAVAEPDMGDLHGRGHPVDQDDLFVGAIVRRTTACSSSPPVELVRLTGIEAEWYVGFRRSLILRL